MQMNVYAVAAALCLLIPAALANPAAVDGPDAQLAKLETMYHVRIHYRLDPSTSFPSTWLDPSLQMVASPIHRQDAETLLPALQQFLASHPAAVLEENLEHIYLLGRLRFRERDYGGTHTGKCMYIVWDQTRKNTPEFILERFHSEFSSILRDHHPFPNQRWQAVNPAGFTYTGTGFEMLGTGSIYDSVAAEQENGFLVKYSRSSLENDFNMMSAWLFTRSTELDAASRQHERILRKRALAEEFYQSLSEHYAFSQPRPNRSL